MSLPMEREQDDFSGPFQPKPFRNFVSLAECSGLMLSFLTSLKLGRRSKAGRSYTKTPHTVRQPQQAVHDHPLAPKHQMIPQIVWISVLGRGSSHHLPQLRTAGSRPDFHISTPRAHFQLWRDLLAGESTVGAAHSKAGNGINELQQNLSACRRTLQRQAWNLC